MASIVGAGVKLGPLRIPLPLTGRVGYLDFVYQDSDIRITRGNRWAASDSERENDNCTVEFAFAVLKTAVEVTAFVVAHADTIS